MFLYVTTYGYLRYTGFLVRYGGVEGNCIAGGDVQLEEFACPDDRNKEARLRIERAAPYLRFYAPLARIETFWYDNNCWVPRWWYRPR